MEIRRARARDLVLTSDAAVLCYLLAGFCLFAIVLVMSLLFDPPFLLLAAWAILCLAVEQRGRRAPRLAGAGSAPPPDTAA